MRVDPYPKKSSNAPDHLVRGNGPRPVRRKRFRGYWQQGRYVVRLIGFPRLVRDEDQVSASSSRAVSLARLCWALEKHDRPKPGGQRRARP